METTLPYHPGFLLGRAADLKSVKPGFMLIGDEVSPTIPQVNLTTSQFSFITSLKDVCDVLSIPPEYALKVKSGHVKNDMVATCLKNLGSDNAFSVVFRTCFLQQKRYLPHDTALQFPKTGNVHEDGGQEHNNTESLIAEAVADTESYSLGSRTNLNGTHWIKALEIGNEQIIVMRISSKDTEKLEKLGNRIGESLKSYRGLFTTEILHALQKTATDIDKKLSKKHYSDTHLDIHYGSFHDLDKYPSEMSGMVKTLETFMDHCTGWADACKFGLSYDPETRVMMRKEGLDVEEKASVTDTLWKKFKDFGTGGSDQPVTYVPSREAHGEVGDRDFDEDHDSFVVLGSSGPKQFYTMRVTLESFQEAKEQEPDLSYSSLALSQYPEATYTMFDRLYKLLDNCDKAVNRIQQFLSSQRFLLENRTDESNQVLKKIQEVHLNVLQTVSNLDFVCLPAEDALAEMLASNPLQTVNKYIETVTSKLPPGSDLDLLMIGKTGHGKSSTGNSILGLERFVSSASGESVTDKTNVGWADIDGRTIKVADTPGVCDTNLETDASSIDLAIQAISDAIANCPEGFHALLLIIRFGIRMTTEEKKAIGLLKCILGEDIVKSHCICVITHGDNFETEMKDKKVSFETWCKSQSGFLKELFEECNYRCVLFNNKASDPKVRKAQLIRLIAKVDSLKGSGTRYTNSLFEFAQRERQRIITEEQVPQVNEEMVRDIQLILEYLNTMVHNTNEQAQYKDELAKLQEKVDNLNNKVVETESGQLGCLVDTVFALAATIHSKMDEIADRPVPDKPEGTDVDAQIGGEAGAEGTTVKRAESPPENNSDLERHRGELQTYYDMEISPQSSMVTQRVREKVEEEVKKDKNCFPGSSTVMLADGKRITLDKLKVGDKVLVRDNTGALVFDTVYMFGHQEFDASKEFIVLSTASCDVCVSHGHLVYCIKDGTELCIAAEKICVEDNVLVATPDGLKVQPVVNITYQRKSGLFAPFTLSGTIIIDNALMSCYVDVLPEATAHRLLWPMRQLYQVSPRTLAFVNGSTSEHPVPRWVNAALKLM